MSQRAHLYINSRGQAVSYHSYSGSDAFNFCARKYYLERVQGWTEIKDNAAKYFGTAIEQAAVQFYHQRGENVTAAGAEFNRIWAEHKDKDYKYSKTDKSWAALSLSGQEFVKLYAIRYPTFPYVVREPRDSFQVKEDFEVFPGTKLAGIRHTAYLDLTAYSKKTDEPMVIDIKTAAKPVPEFTVLDPQLRSYSWIKNWPLVAFLWFRKMGRTIDRGDVVTLLESTAMVAAGTELTVMDRDDFGLFLTADQKVLDGMAQFVGSKKEVVAARTAYVATNSIHVSENLVTKQRIEFKSAIISQDSRDDIERSIKRDIVNITTATERDFFAMQSGVRYPNEKCPNCPMRGICSDRPELRDLLVVRKHREELDFSAEDE